MTVTGSPTQLGPGHKLVRRVYAHLGDVRHRSEVVEYRLEQHLDRLGDRLQRLVLAGASVTRNATTDEARLETESPDATEVTSGEDLQRAGDRTRTGDVQLGKLAFYH